MVKESGKLYVCEQENGRVRVVNLRTLFCHASQIVQGDTEESQREEKDYAVRRICKIHVHVLPLFLKAMYRFWCHHLPYVRLHSIALNSLCQTRSSYQDFFNFWCCRRGEN